MIEYIGNTELLKLHKTAFFAPGKIAVSSVLPCYDWANDMVKNGECVISGFYSPLETDVWKFLVRGKQPIILVLTRHKYKTIPKLYADLINSGRLLIIFLNLGMRINRNICIRRNEYIASIADKLVFASMKQDSSLYPIYKYHINKSIIK